MYDFVLGTREQMIENEIGFLTAVKRMLPRWLNSIPDSEFVALCELADESGALAAREGAVFVETGVGASTLALYWYAAKHGVHAYSWDISAAKAAVIRQVCSEAFGMVVSTNINEHWTLVPWMSTSPVLGIETLAETGQRVALSFHDSEHTWANVSGELQAVLPLLVDGAIVALDDANLTWTDVNWGLANTFRKKLGWPLVAIAELESPAEGPAHWELAQRLLSAGFANVHHVEDSYKQHFADDPYFAWYNVEFKEKALLGTERTDALEHRFDAFVVSGRHQ